MSTLSLRAFSTLHRTPSGDSVQIPLEPGSNIAAVTFTTTEGRSDAIGQMNIIGMISNHAYRYEVGEDPHATAASWGPIPANTPFFIWVQQGHKIAVIEA